MKKKNSKTRNNRSTAKGTEAKLIEHMNKVEQRLGKEFEQVQNALRATRRDLMAEIMGVDGRLMGVERQLMGVERHMTDADTKLIDKIDSIHVRLDDHEVRIATLEAPAKP